MPLWLKLIAVAICLGGAIYAIRKYALLSSKNAAIQCVRLEKDHWLLITKSNIELEANLLGTTWWSSHLLILNFETTQANKKVSVIILPDMLEKDTFRRMRVYLNMEAST